MCVTTTRALRGAKDGYARRWKRSVCQSTRGPIDHCGGARSDVRDARWVVWAVVDVPDRAVSGVIDADVVGAVPRGPPRVDAAGAAGSTSRQHAACPNAFVVVAHPENERGRQFVPGSPDWFGVSVVTFVELNMLRIP